MKVIKISDALVEKFINAGKNFYQAHVEMISGFDDDSIIIDPAPLYELDEFGLLQNREVDEFATLTKNKAESLEFDAFTYADIFVCVIEGSITNGSVSLNKGDCALIPHSTWGSFSGSSIVASVIVH